MKILVTGGAGFIGSHIVDALILAGHEVIIVDNLSTGSVDNINTDAIFYRLDICDKELNEVFDKRRPDVVLHEAAQVVVTDSVTDPVRDANINILGSLNVIYNSIKYKVKKLIYASSCAVYGNPLYLPLNERHPIDPLAPYGVSKHTVEHYLNLYHLLFRLKFVALRYGNVYGPRQNAHGEAGVVAIFTSRMIAGKQPVIYGLGDNTRAYVYVDDVVKANILAMESDKVGIYNIGTRRETTVLEIFDLLKKEIRFTGSPIMEIERPGEIEHMSLDCTKAKADLNWEPTTSLKDGVKNTARFYNSRFTVKSRLS